MVRLAALQDFLGMGVIDLIDLIIQAPEMLFVPLSAAAWFKMIAYS
jgi:hypothetical protein